MIKSIIAVSFALATMTATASDTRHYSATVERFDAIPTQCIDSATMNSTTRLYDSLTVSHYISVTTESCNGVVFGTLITESVTLK